MAPPTLYISQVSNWQKKHVEKSQEDLAKSKTRKNNHQHSENEIFPKWNLCTYVPNVKDPSWLMRPCLQIWVWYILVIKYVKVTQLRWNSNLICRVTYWEYIPSSTLVSQSMVKKSPENSVGRTERRMDGHCQSIIRPHCKGPYKTRLCTMII